jgi:hypothetical protein
LIDLACPPKSGVYWQASLITSQLNDGLNSEECRESKFFKLILKNPKFDVYCKASLITAKTIR